MLKGIDSVLSGDMLKTLCDMGHGDEIVFCDAMFPAAKIARACGATLLRADGIDIPRLLKAINPIFDLDKYSTPVVMMQAVEGDVLDPAVEKSYVEAIGYNGVVKRIDRDDFYDRAMEAYAIVATGDTSQYGNVILVKGNFT